MLDSILHPKSIAVIGVSLEPEKVGHQVFANLLSFSGELFPVNPKHKKIGGRTCYPDLLSIPKAVDLVIIATPGPTVEDIVRQCVDKKVKGVIIITAGFAENERGAKNGKIQGGSRKGVRKGSRKGGRKIKRESGSHCQAD
jgi:acetyltransferase